MIIKLLEKMIEENTKAQVLKLTTDQARKVYDYFDKYHFNSAPASFNDMIQKEKLFYMGRKIEIYESEV